MQRNMPDPSVVRRAYDALQAGRFAAARELAAPISGGGAGAVLHALARAGCGEDAAGALDMIARANPGARHPVHDLVELLERHGRGDEAAPHLRVAAALAPGDAEVAGRLGAALARTGPMDEAVAAFRRAAALRPGDAAGWSNLGKALAAVGAFAEAEGAFARAGGLAPGDAQIGLNHAVARLKSGRLAEGWGLFRARHRLPGRSGGAAGTELRSLEGVAGRTVLLLHVEGFGDTIQFIRYARLLEERGARVVARVPDALARLLAWNGVRLAGAGEPYDCWCRIADLPGVFGTTLESIPGALPYLAADPALVAAWRARLPAGRRGGLVWAGAARLHDPAARETDRQRSIPVAALAPLVDVSGIAWVSLQEGHAAPGGVANIMPGVRDFADTAAIIAGLSFVVSVDTAVAHLAAAMGRPVLLLDRFDHCWRWLPGREDSPWYPGVVRVVRQKGPGEWGAVLAQAAMICKGNENIFNNMWCGVNLGPEAC